MSRFSPEQLQTWSGGAWRPGAAAPAAVNGFSNDTRALLPGNCFVALRTGQRDGHDFLEAAARAGAVAALVARPVPSSPLPQLVVDDTLAALQRIARAWRENYTAPVIGVTGSVGKTSTKDMLGAMLGAAGFATRANLNNLLGVPLMLLGVDPARHTAGAVIEAGMSEPGELERAASIIQPDIAVITNVQPAHLAGLGSLEAIAREKSALARRVRAGGAAIFPVSCLEHAAFRELAVPAIPVAFPGETLPADGRHERIFRIEFLDTPSGRRIRLRDGTGVVGELDFPESTRGMACNAALAAVAALRAGLSVDRIQAALAGWEPSARRGEVREYAGRLFYIDCYNASPASVVDAAEAFDRRTRNAGGGRLFVLAGMNELGPVSAALHEQVGRQLPLRAGDTLVLFGGDSAAIGAGALAAGFPAASVRALADIDAVRAAVENFTGPVLLKGSRSYALERALPGALNDTGDTHH